MKEFPNSYIAYLVDEYIHNKRDREILKAHYIDGDTAEFLAEKHGLTPRRVSQILSDSLIKLVKHM